MSATDSSSESPGLIYNGKQIGELLRVVLFALSSNTDQRVRVMPWIEFHPNGCATLYHCGSFAADNHIWGKFLNTTRQIGRVRSPDLNTFAHMTKDSCDSLSVRARFVGQQNAHIKYSALRHAAFAAR